MAILCWSSKKVYEKNKGNYPNGRFRVCETMPFSYKKEQWENEGGPDGKLGWVIYAENSVLYRYEENGYNDSDFMAVYWNGSKVITTTYATTRGWSYLNQCDVDATDEIKDLAREWEIEKAKPMVRGRNWQQAHTIRKGDKVQIMLHCFECEIELDEEIAKLVKPYAVGEQYNHTNKVKSIDEECPRCGADISAKGMRNPPEIGAVGEVFWRGKCSYSGSERVGVLFENDKKMFIDINREEKNLCVSRLDWRKDLWDEEQICAMAKRTGRSRRW